jgi:hypothetical protein
MADFDPGLMIDLEKKLLDREWRMDNLYHVKDKHGNKVRFVRWESQMQFWKAMWYLNIILKDRQRGFSTLFAIFILDSCLFNSNIQAGIIDISLPDAQKKLDKISFAYDNLPEFLKTVRTTTVDSKTGIEFDNGSTVYVGTSHRGGTLQILHISEFGKISVRFPERAREIKTGALNTVAAGNFVFMESTAEGSAGEFFEFCKRARDLIDRNQLLTKMDYKFHFFGWWEGTENEIDPEGIIITDETTQYLDKLEKVLGFEITPRKRAWYAKKSEEQGDDMLREYPSTPDEAFAAALEGVYLAGVIKKMKQQGQFTLLPIDPGVPVNTGWDFGLSDHMTIWLHQRVKFTDRLIGYMFGTDEDIFYYWKELKNLGHIYGYHFLPHDGASRRIGTARSAEEKPKTIEDLLKEAGMTNIKVVPRIPEKYVAIQEVKRWLPQVFIDPGKCKKGIECLENFRREYDDNMGKFKDHPLHNWAQHGYDGLETLARGLNAHGVITDVPFQAQIQVPLSMPYDAGAGY